MRRWCKLLRAKSKNTNRTRSTPTYTHEHLLQSAEDAIFKSFSLMRIDENWWLLLHSRDNSLIVCRTIVSHTRFAFHLKNQTQNETKRNKLKRNRHIKKTTQFKRINSMQVELQWKEFECNFPLSNRIQKNISKCALTIKQMSKRNSHLRFKF